MKSHTQSSASGKLRVSAYVGACAAWAASGHEAVADPIHGYFDVSENSVQITDEATLTAWNLGVAGNFNFIIDPPLQAGENPRSGFIWAAQLGESGFINSDLKFATIDNPDTTKSLQARVDSGYYTGAALKRYGQGAQIDGAAILGNGGVAEYTAGYLFHFDDITGVRSGEFTTGNTYMDPDNSADKPKSFVGFAFSRTRQIDGGVDIYSGWISIESIADDYSSFNILDWSYSLGSITTPGSNDVQPQEAVPEPSSLGLLAVGAAGILRYRRRRRTGEVTVETQPAA